MTLLIKVTLFVASIKTSTVSTLPSPWVCWTKPSKLIFLPVILTSASVMILPEVPPKVKSPDVATISISVMVTLLSPRVLSINTSFTPLILTAPPLILLVPKVWILISPGTGDSSTPAVNLTSSWAVRLPYKSIVFFAVIVTSDPAPPAIILPLSTP